MIIYKQSKLYTQENSQTSKIQCTRFLLDAKIKGRFIGGYLQITVLYQNPCFTVTSSRRKFKSFIFFFSIFPFSIHCFVKIREKPMKNLKLAIISPFRNIHCSHFVIQIFPVKCILQKWNKIGSAAKYIVQQLREKQGQNFISASNYLCDLEEVASILCALVSSFVKRRYCMYLLHRVLMRIK